MHAHKKTSSNQLFSLLQAVGPYKIHSFKITLLYSAPSQRYRSFNYHYLQRKSVLPN